MKKKIHSMWKMYNNPTELNEETRYLSLRGARYEVHLGTNTTIQVRCREYSTIWYICKNFGYIWDGPNILLEKDKYSKYKFDSRPFLASL